MLRNEGVFKSVGERLALCLEQVGAARLGESTVISRSVHLIEVKRPQVVKIMTSADAGQVFYGRRVPGTVCHIDIFHAVGQVDHRNIADAIRAVVHSAVGENAAWILDHMDLQTGTGGGRLSGTLNYGREASVRRAHANHVHLATEMDPALFSLFVPVVVAIEEEILRQKIEIRQVEKVVLENPPQSAGGTADLSPYASSTDSYLREKTGQPHSGFVGQRASDELQKLNHTLQLARETLPPEELLVLLRNLPQGSYTKANLEKRWGDLEQTLSRLEGSKYIRRERGRFVLTEEGQRLMDLLEQHLPELESYFRQMLRHVPWENAANLGFFEPEAKKSIHLCRPGRTGTEILRSTELDLPGTIFVAARRWLKLRGDVGRLEPTDLRYTAPKRRHQQQIVLVLDISASMAGERLRAARFLAEHLVLATRDKVAVIAFQEQNVFVPDRFTRRLAAVEKQLLALKAYGLTPLAKALKETVAFIQSSRVRNPLIILITDGIPTVPFAGGDPAHDALEVAKELAKLKLKLICVGLDPNRQFLEELCRHSRGRLHIVKELEPGILARLIHGELAARQR
jgi:magnesium chelatase subunit D